MAAVQEGITHLLPNTATNISDSDLNDLTGEICVGYGNNCTNRPVGAGNGYFINFFTRTTKEVLKNEQLDNYCSMRVCCACS